MQPPIETDALVIGAGPVGLFQVFQLGLLGIQAHVVDALPFAGGQCAQLYGDKPIYDIPAITVCTGQDLTDRLVQQASVFSPTYHWSQHVAQFVPLPDGRLSTRTDSGTCFFARTVFIAAGVGAFLPKTLKIETLTPLVGHSVFYEQAAPQPAKGSTLVIGGDSAAVQRAIELGNPSQPVTLSHRRDQFDINAAQQEALRECIAAGTIQLRIGLPTEARVENGQLCAVGLTVADGSLQWIDANVIEAYLGVSPTLAALKEWGIDLDRRCVRIDPSNCATSLPGVFAAGDVVSYPGKKKLIVCGFHEACMAAYGAQAHLWPGKTFPLQYTSSSSHLHALLGVGH
ncbi:NAD(P)/FAD-dependent oxidoreductase [Curvibacter sp. APW13]|uniref:NAD(P)/FAD-dependent oxidoreductase n=1 Tax=Curvibacter sp. APW13 TaxID=3077236 RepID=UPI0028E04C6A|nr:NAD(P)/FAD-dependent oxidoreductase [Curvibacter sp. APW13]MDT8991662.1 NAD(P)/FAD-dependent oxidoreductase [Curvibacter sp. APW13]